MLANRRIFIALLLGQFCLPGPAGADDRDSFLVPGKYYNFYFVPEHNPLKRGELTVYAVKVTAVGKNSWAKIAFPTHEKDHLAILGACASDQEKFKKTGVPTAEHLKAWEAGVKDWQQMWVNLDYVTRITDLDETVARGEIK